MCGTAMVQESRTKHERSKVRSEVSSIELLSDMSSTGRLPLPSLPYYRIFHSSLRGNIVPYSSLTAVAG
jgi:hypothetical protein